mgnify:FL=1
MEVFPKRKELASLKQLFVLHGNEGDFLHASPLNAGPCKVCKVGEDKLKKIIEKNFKNDVTFSPTFVSYK